MSLDKVLLDAHSFFEDPRLGIAERFVRLTVGGEPTFGVVSSPLGLSRDPAWVVCHSFGREIIDLNMTEVAIARRLAAAGYPVLRFHCQGYGDSGSAYFTPSLGSHVRDTKDAVEQMKEIAGTQKVGVMGARFGGTVAALTADQADLPFLAMISPVVRGQRYVGDYLRVRAIIEMSEAADAAAPPVEEDQEKDKEDADSIIKFDLPSEILDELTRTDLISDLIAFHGRALLLHVAPISTANATLNRLAERLEQLGAEQTLNVAHYPGAVHFGLQHFKPVDKYLLIDTLAELHGALAQKMLDWIEGDALSELGGGGAV